MYKEIKEEGKKRHQEKKKHEEEEEEEEEEKLTWFMIFCANSIDDISATAKIS